MEVFVNPYMNKKQVSYQVGRVFNSGLDLIFGTIAVDSGISTVENVNKFVDGVFKDDRFDMVWHGISTGVYGSIMALTGAVSVGFLLSRIAVYTASIAANRNKEKYPLEFVEKVNIYDHHGLEKILEKTKEGGKKEWGTILKSNVHQPGVASVNYILTSERAIEEGYIKDSSKLHVVFTNKYFEQGFNGQMHFHPPQWKLEGVDYAVNIPDRTGPPGQLNLLTFNIAGEPEIIAFNKRHTYIPINSSKRELVKASPKEIMEYLK